MALTPTRWACNPEGQIGSTSKGKRVIYNKDIGVSWSCFLLGIVDEIGPHIIQLESIHFSQMDIDISHTRIRKKPLDMDMAITSH